MVIGKEAILKQERRKEKLANFLRMKTVSGVTIEIEIGLA